MSERIGWVPRAALHLMPGREARESSYEGKSLEKETPHPAQVLNRAAKGAYAPDILLTGGLSGEVGP